MSGYDLMSKVIANLASSSTDPSISSEAYIFANKLKKSIFFLESLRLYLLYVHTDYEFFLIYAIRFFHYY